jgi:hypothetical protein
VAQGVSPAVLPAVITYNGFKHFGKKVFLMLGSAFPATTFFTTNTKQQNEASQRNNFNNHVMEQMTSLFKEPPSKKYKRPLYLFPIIGIAWLWHTPLYISIKTFVAYKTKGTVFYDSVLFALLLFIYPLYLILLFILLYKTGVPNFMNCLIIAAHPLLAIIYTQSKK